MKSGDQIYLLLATLTWGRAALFGALATGFYFIALYNDGSALQRTLAETRAQIAQTEQQIKITKDALTNADRFEKEVKSAVEQFHKVYEIMPEKMSVAELTTISSDLAARAGLKLVRTEPKSIPERTDFYEASRLGLALEGSFSQVLMFLSYISKVSRLMTLEKVELVSLNGTDPELPILSFSGTLVGYRYLRPPGGPSADPSAAKPGGASGGQ